jgi:hypothetical protein
MLMQQAAQCVQVGHTNCLQQTAAQQPQACSSEPLQERKQQQVHR